MVTPRPFLSLSQRRRIERLIDLLIGLLDAIDGDGDGDEPSDNGIADLDALLVIERAA